ncbi:hypothetical protein EDC96DRAFT_513466 [Choanephora cucurbitarum]|nr:hypothetical protein EDC96DRAFT_513466 [Choanephora cucurbitarum]
MGDSSQLVVPSSSSSQQNHAKNTLNKPTEQTTDKKKPNKRHNNRGKGKKKNPNVVNATEVGTPHPEAKPEEAKPEAKKKPKHPKRKVTQDKGSSAAARITKNRAQGRLTEESTEEPSTPKKKRNNRQRTHPSLPEGNHDMATLLSHELKTSTYECMICMDVVKPAHHIWTCDCCWAMFHLNCVQTWASRSLKDTSSNKMITAWRCPGCQNSRMAVPKDYLCFCGKQRNPEPSKYTTPHSCDQLCKRHKSCPHECVLPCHPGPCPPCDSMGPVLTCYCGQTTRQQRCIDTDYQTKGFSCLDLCDELLGCGKHRCQEACHAGLCPPCELEEIQSCYCGRHERTARCGNGQQIQIGGHVGYYSCQERCDATFACGQHRCEKACHPCTASTQVCPYDPSEIKTCPCGAHTMMDLLHAERTSCTDPVPTCTSTCNKPLPCGHACPDTCHAGDCAPCQAKVEVACRCQSNSFEDLCSHVCEASGGEPPLCDRVCRSVRNCGRHTCGQKCCPAMKVKGKRRPGTDHVHDCPEVCGQLLSCGIHACQDKCHKGKCRPCLEATFEDVTCHCGRTRLEPPVRCGTKLPPCPHPCTRPNPCGHIRFLNHNCHPDNEPCPPCPTLVSRPCLCGKTELKNVPCYRESPRCGRVCEKVLSCGKHVCLKTCHSGPCLNETCTQICGGTRARCGHVCKAKCHDGQPCPEHEPCQAKITAICSCGQNSLELPCNATAESDGSKRELECNDFCAKVLRNRRLAMALDIKRDDLMPSSPTLSSSSLDTKTLSIDDLGYYDDSLREFYLDNANWCRQIENTMIEFVKETDRKSFHFKPMRSEYRRFIHRYAVHFNLQTEAIDSEPKRSVILRKSMGVCRIPPILLSRAARNPSLNRPPPSLASTPPEVDKTSKQPVNALYLSDMAFGLTKLELDADLVSLIKIGDDTIHFTSKWVNENDAIVVPSINDAISMDEKEKIIWQLKKTVKAAFIGQQESKAARIDCCWVNQKGEVSWSEKDLVQPKKTAVTPTVQHRSLNAYDILNAVDDDGWMKVGGNNPYRPVKDPWSDPPKSSNTSVDSETKEQPEIDITLESSSKSNLNEPDDWENLLDDDNEQ